jgi:hypothetical protein
MPDAPQSLHFTFTSGLFLTTWMPLVMNKMKDSTRIQYKYNGTMLSGKEGPAMVGDLSVFVKER